MQAPWSEDKLYKIINFERAKCLSDGGGIYLVHDRSKAFIVPKVIAIISEISSHIKSRYTDETAVYIFTNKKDNSFSFYMFFLMIRGNSDGSIESDSNVPDFTTRYDRVEGYTWKYNLRFLRCAG